MLSVVCHSCAGITLLLSMTVFQLIIADKVPESSQAVPLVGRLNDNALICLHVVVCCSNNYEFSFILLLLWDSSVRLNSGLSSWFAIQSSSFCTIARC